MMYSSSWLTIISLLASVTVLNHYSHINSQHLYMDWGITHAVNACMNKTYWCDLPAQVLFSETCGLVCVCVRVCARACECACVSECMHVGVNFITQSQ